MRRTRVIAVLLFDGTSLVKTQRFSDPLYLGDPLNAMRIFAEREVDELMFLDICAMEQGREPNFALLERVLAEAAMPLAYGGGIRSIAAIERLASLGIDKVVLNDTLHTDPGVVGAAARLLGSQAVVAAIDYRGQGEAARVFRRRGQIATSRTPLEMARIAQDAGVGELLLTSVDREGTRDGYDEQTIQSVVTGVNVPVVAHGGAGTLEHLRRMTDVARVSGVAAGSLFSVRGKHRAVLITYPTDAVLSMWVP